jgi:hypothetical protein
VIQNTSPGRLATRWRRLYRTIASLTMTDDAPLKQRIPPFEELEIDLGYILGE